MNRRTFALRNMKQFVDEKFKILIAFFFVAFLIWGITVLPDYGISFDEEIQRQRGIIYTKYIVENILKINDVPVLFDSVSQMNQQSNESLSYGVAVKLPLMIIEYLTAYKMTNSQVFFLNHLYTFLLFYISSMCMFLICKEIGFNDKYSFLGVLFYVLSPRILGDSFYNIKDSVFLSLFTIVCYLALLTLTGKVTKKIIAFFVIVSAIALNTRVIMAIPLAVFMIYYIFRCGIQSKKNIKKNFLHVCMISAAILMVYIFISPAAWKDPIYYFKNLFENTIDYNWHSTIPFLGRAYRSTDLPWYYLIMSIIVTVPLRYCVFLLYGVIFAKSFVLKNDSSVNGQIICLLVSQFLLILIIDAILQPTKYNMWRQFYFLHFYLTVISVFGVYCMLKHKSIKVATGVSVVLSLGISIMNILMIHPLEGLYFNPVFKDAILGCEKDYWHISYYPLQKSIDADRVDTAFVDQTGVRFNALFFGERGFENHHNINELYGAEYVITNNSINAEKIYRLDNEVSVGGVTMSSRYKRNNYYNCIQKYSICQNGEVIPEGTYINIMWKKYHLDNHGYIEAAIPDYLYVREIDIYNSSGLKGGKLMLSEDGKEWYYADSSAMLNDLGNMTAIATDTFLPGFIRIEYPYSERFISNESHIRVYGDGIDFQMYDDYISVYTDDSSTTHYLSDGDPTTEFLLEYTTTTEKEILLTTKDRIRVGGILFYSSGDYSDSPDVLEVYGKDSKISKEWKKINFEYCMNSKLIVFDTPDVYTDFRLLTNGDMGKTWVIQEMKLVSNPDWKRGCTNHSLYEFETNVDEAKDSIGFINDGLYETRWTSNANQKEGQFIQFKVNGDKAIFGLSLQLHDSINDYPEDMTIYGRKAGGEWIDIVYSCEDSRHERYLFKKPVYFDEYRLVINKEKSWWWSVHEIRTICSEETGNWSIQDTSSMIKDAFVYGENDSTIHNSYRNDFRTAWISEENQNEQMYVIFELNSSSKISGIYMDSGGSMSENPKKIKLYGSNDMNDWEYIAYSNTSPNDYRFAEYLEYKYYKVCQTANDENNKWKIAQFGLIH